MRILFFLSLFFCQYFLASHLNAANPQVDVENAFRGFDRHLLVNLRRFHEGTYTYQDLRVSLVRAIYLGGKQGLLGELGDSDPEVWAKGVCKLSLAELFRIGSFFLKVAASSQRWHTNMEICRSKEQRARIAGQIYGNLHRKRKHEDDSNKNDPNKSKVNKRAKRSTVKDG